MIQDQFIFVVMVGAILAAGFLLLSFCAARIQGHKALLELRVSAEKKRRRRAAALAESTIEVS